ncbi:MAG: ABC transporter permease [Magnetovibrio sp.]|nr:ABC transporter permease [Magnetovibrio sp.]
MALDWPLIGRLLRREMRGGLKGFRVFLACLALGVAAIAGVGSIGASVTAGLKSEARDLLGGDVDLRLLHREFEAGQLDWLRAHGAGVSEIIKMRAMARPTAARDRRSLVELKAVDAAYPMVGAFKAQPQRPLAELLAKRNGAWGAVVDANLLPRLGLQTGDTVRVGAATFQLRATVVDEPDRVASLFSLGPRLLISRTAVAETGLVLPGSQIRYHARVLLKPGTGFADWRAELDTAFPSAGWRVRSPDGAAPGVRRFIERMTLFLSFVGLTVLLVGGLGVANTVASYLERKTATIATLKCLGAPGRLVFALYMAQVAVLAGLGTAVGVAAGGTIAYAFALAAAGRMPITPVAGVYAEPLATAALFGMLVAVTFALWPVARAREVLAAQLFRDAVAPVTQAPRRLYVVAAVVGVALLGLFTIVTAEDRYFASWFVAGALATMALLRLGAAAVTAWARRLKIRNSPNLRLAVANLHRPGASTVSVMLSLGCGLAVLVAVGLIQGNLARQVAERLPEKAPAFFFIDIQPHQVAAFDAAVTGVEAAGNYRRVPTLRGRIVKIDGTPVDRAQVAPESQWAIRGDRALTFARARPDAAEITAGAWWPADYAGPPIISLDAGLARGFGIGLGDTLTFNVLGREITATVKSLREIDWRSLRFDFAIIFAPGALDGAPHTHIAAIEAPTGAEDAVEKAATDGFPNISAIRVRDALSAAANLLAGISAAVTGTAAVTVLAGALVLAAAIAAHRRRQLYDSVIFKVLGATRRRLLGVFLVEYGVLGVVTAAVASAVGTLAAWAIVRFLMHMPWVFLPETVAATALACVLVTLFVGFLGTWQVLGRKATPYLRNQ